MPNYKTDWFVETLTRVAGKTDFSEAIVTWKFSHFGVLSAINHCQLCHTQISSFVAIKCELNGTCLMIGNDCYRKMVMVLSGKMDIHTLPSIKEVRRDIKRHFKKMITPSFITWFFVERASVPDDIIAIRDFILKFKHAPSIEAADKIIEFYKNHRRFHVNDLLGLTDRSMYSSMPGEKRDYVTMSELPEIKSAIEKYRRDQLAEITRKNEVRQRAMNKMREHEALKTPIVLEDPELFHDSGIYSEPLKYWTVEPRLQLRFKIDEVPFIIDLPRRAFKNILGIKNWTQEVNQAFKETMPASIIPDLKMVSYLKLGEVDQGLWIERVKAYLKNKKN